MAEDNPIPKVTKNMKNDVFSFRIVTKVVDFMNPLPKLAGLKN